MESQAVAVSGFLIILLAVCAGVIWLQIFLSKRESRWPGLILPGISFLASLIGVIGIAALSAVRTTTSTQLFTENGVVVEQFSTWITGSPASVVWTVLYVFLLCNIPTGVLLAVYAACRSKRKKLRDLGKMSVQDLE